MKSVSSICVLGLVASTAHSFKVDVTRKTHTEHPLKRLGLKNLSPELDVQSGIYYYGAASVGGNQTSTAAYSSIWLFDTMLNQTLIPSYNCTTCTYPVYNPNTSPTYWEVDQGYEFTGNWDQFNSMTGYIANDTICLPPLPVEYDYQCADQQLFFAITEMVDVPDYFYGAIGLGPVIFPSDKNSQDKNFFYNLANQKNYIPTFMIDYYREGTNSSINFGDSYVTYATNQFFDAVSDDGFWELTITDVYYGEKRISWADGNNRKAIVDTSSPFLVMDTENYDQLANTMISKGFTCKDGDKYLVNCYSSNTDLCSEDDETLTFTLLSGIDNDVPVNQSVPAINYYWVNSSNICNFMVTYSDSLDADTIILADPFVITFVISFNLFMQSMYIGPKSYVTQQLVDKSISGEGVAALVISFVTIVAVLAISTYIIIKKHKERQVFYDQGMLIEDEEGLDRKAKKKHTIESEAELLDAAAKVGTDEMSHDNFD